MTWIPLTEREPPLNTEDAAAGEFAVIELLTTDPKLDPFKCFHPRCTVSPRAGGTVFRINAKGQPGIYACRKHMKNTDAKIAPEVAAVVEAVESCVERDPDSDECEHGISPRYACRECRTDD
jgi:hypothetical protein